MCGDGKVHGPPPIVTENYKNKQQAEPSCRNHEEIGRDDILNLAGQEGVRQSAKADVGAAPCSWRPSSPR